MSCVPVLAPDLVNLNRTSLEESTQEDVKTFCVFVFVSVEVIVTVPKPSVGDIETLVPATILATPCVSASSLQAGLPEASVFQTLLAIAPGAET